jgi:subtilisin family serine protease
MRRAPIGVTVFVAALAVFLATVTVSSQGRRVGRLEVEDIGAREAAAREILVKFHQPPQPGRLAQLLAETDAGGVQPVGRSGIIRIVSRTRSAAALLAALRQRPDIQFVEPNYVVRTMSEPSDPQFPQLWGLKNVGQPVNGGSAGTAGADMRAAEAWDIAVGSASHVVAVVDTGIDYTHGDLAPNMWSAPAPFTVTIRGVNITCQAGTHGFNAITKTCDPMDDHNHGTHVAGTIGAVGNNAAGVVGVNWITSLMGLKFLDATGSGTTADAIDAIDFALQAKQIFAASGGANIRILSNSWGGGDFSQALLDIINEAAADDMLFVAAAGNNGLPNDILPMYPASYAAPNIIAVAATTNTDTRAFFSNYGAKTVHLGAPGVNILSTLRAGNYGFQSGTSMATPHVSGAAALTLSHCALNTATLKTALLDAVDPVPSMAATTITGGRLNARRTLESCSAPPTPPANLVASAADRQVRLSWSVVGGATRYRVKRSTTPGGPYVDVTSNVKGLQFTDTGLTNGTTYYYVVSAINLLGESAPSVEASATPKLPADMVISFVNMPLNAAAGGPMALSVTTKNQGTGLADPSTTKLYVSTDMTWHPTDTVVPGAQLVPSLAPGLSVTTSLTTTIPSDLLPGPYYLIAKADADDVLFENVESNNTYARRFLVGPDLVISTFSLPSTGTPGTTVNAAYTIRNQGAEGAGGSVLETYWSTNSTLDAGDPVLTRTDIGSLAANGTQSGQIPIVIPGATAQGTYYVFARIDSAGAVSESSESNNTTLDLIQVGADLVSDITSPSAVGVGIPFVVTDTTRNAGTVSIGQSVTHFYLSPNASLSADDTLIGTRTVAGLGPGELSTGNTPLTIPGSKPAGAYYVFAKADGANAIPETNESNNLDLQLVNVGPDLNPRITAITSAVTAGNTTLVTETITNLGGNDAAPSVVRYYLSANNVTLDATDVVLAETRAIGVLAPGATSTAQTPVTIPLGTTPGTYYLIVKADANGSVAESSETNNTHVRQVSVN